MKKAQREAAAALKKGKKKGKKKAKKAAPPAPVAGAASSKDLLKKPTSTKVADSPAEASAAESAVSPGDET